MTETLWAVIIGGSIGLVGGVVATIPSLIINERRWKKEKKLEHLRAERKYRLEQYSLVLNKLPDYIQGEGDWDWDMVSRILLGLPEEIVKEIYAVLQKTKNKKVNKEEVKRLYGLISNPMRKSLDEIDRKIKELMS